MKILTKLKYKIASYKIIKLLKKQNRKTEQTTIAQAQNIGIIFNSVDNNDIETILNFFKNKNVFILGFCKDKKLFKKNNYFSRKDFSWDCKLKTENLKNFVEQNFDILLNLDLQNNILLQYLSLISQAKFKIGVYNNLNCKILDLMLNFEHQNNILISDFIEQINIYTNILTKK